MKRQFTPPFQGDLNQALARFLKNDPEGFAGEFWNTEAIATAVENANNADKSLNVLRKHLPAKFHPLIRFAQPNLTWYLNVEKGITANQLNLLLDDLLLLIAKDIGYAPRLRVVVQPSHQLWKSAGFPITHPLKTHHKLPEEAEAQTIIDNFIKK